MAGSRAPAASASALLVGAALLEMKLILCCLGVVGAWMQCHPIRAQLTACRPNSVQPRPLTAQPALRPQPEQHSAG